MLAGRGAFLYMQSAYAEAEALLDDALTLEPSNALWHCARANILFDSGRVRGAEADLARALELDRRCAPAYLQQAPTILTRLVSVVRCPVRKQLTVAVGVQARAHGALPRRQIRRGPVSPTTVAALIALVLWMSLSCLSANRV